MPLFRCSILGEDFPGGLGFYTTRFVEAKSPDEAERAALARLKDDPDLAVLRPTETDKKSAKVFFERIVEVQADTPRTPDKGFSFFPMAPPPS